MIRLCDKRLSTEMKLFEISVTLFFIFIPPDPVNMKGFFNVKKKEILQRQRKQSLHYRKRHQYPQGLL